MESQQLGRTAHLHDQATTRVRILEDERNMLEAKVHKLESELNAMELSRDSLRKDKANVGIVRKLLHTFQTYSPTFMPNVKALSYELSL